ncbi:MAG: pitrilysin family protein [Planctomycetota bacterium]
MFKRILLLFVLFVLSGCSGSPTLDMPAAPKPGGAGRATHPDQLTFPALEVKIPKPDRTVLANGFTVFLMEDDELPLITIKVLIRNGAVEDQPGKAGTANLVARLMRTGGTTKYTAEALDEKLEFISAELSASAYYEDMDLRFSFLSRDLDECLDILKEVLFHPAFPEDKLAKEKERILESIRRQNDEPDDIAGREFRKLVYSNHPFGNEIHGSAETIANITVADLKAFHKKYFTPDNMMLAVVGSLPAAPAAAAQAGMKKNDMIARLNDIFKEIPLRPLTHRFPDKPLSRTFSKSVNLINKDVNQSVIQFGHLGIERLNPDYFKIITMNAILGGSSVSRLYDQVREQRGLAYGIGSYFTLSSDTGMFIISTSTKNESVAQVISIILEEIKKMQTDLVSEEELKNTKEGTLNGFVFRFENPVRVVEQYMYIEHIGLPEDYLPTWRDNIMKVTREEVREMARKYINIEDYKLLVVGDSAKFDKPLSEFGTVNEIKLDSPASDKEPRKP